MTVCRAIIGSGGLDAVWFLEDVGFLEEYACLLDLFSWVFSIRGIYLCDLMVYLNAWNRP